MPRIECVSLPADELVGITSGVNEVVGRRPISLRCGSLEVSSIMPGSCYQTGLLSVGFAHALVKIPRNGTKEAL